MDDILRFIVDFSVDVDGVGHVCRYPFVFIFSTKIYLRSSYAKLWSSFCSMLQVATCKLNYLFSFKNLAALVSSTSRDMEIENMDRHTSQLVSGGVARGKWRSRS